MGPQVENPIPLHDLFRTKEKDMAEMLESLASGCPPSNGELCGMLKSLQARGEETCWTCSREEMLRALNKRNPQFCFKCKQSALNSKELLDARLAGFVCVQDGNYVLRKELFQQNPTLLETLFGYLEKAVHIRRKSSRNYARLCPGHSFSREPLDKKQWEETWAKLPGQLKMKVLSLEESSLAAYLRIHLGRFQLCVDCAEMVHRSLEGLLFGFDDGKRVQQNIASNGKDNIMLWAVGEEHSKLYFRPFEVQKRGGKSVDSSGNVACDVCENVSDLVVKVNVRNARMLVHKAFEAEAKFEISKAIQAETHRHATSIIQGQRELLYCIGSFIMDRTKDAWEEHVASCYTAALVLWTVLDCIRQKITHVYRETTEVDSSELLAESEARVETKTETDVDVVPCSVKRCSVKRCKVAIKKDVPVPVPEPTIQICTPAEEVLEEDPIRSLRLKQYLNSPERQALRSKLRNNFRRYCEEHANGCLCHLKNIYT